jgi:hypothetical protein
MIDCSRINSAQLERLEALREQYKLLYNEPDACRPMIIVNINNREDVSWEEKLTDPLVMLQSKLREIKDHLDMEDDFLPAVRVDFGTGLIASAFGCQIIVPENNLPAVSSHPLKNIHDIYKIKLPAEDAGMLKKMFEWIETWRENLPQWLPVQIPDIQGPFNNAHLVRGNDILTDFYDDPRAVEHLLDLITDYTISIVNKFNRLFQFEKGWFCDWGGGYWKGSARISNCSTDMISPDFYEKYVLPRDNRLLSSVGGGRMHYCGGHSGVLENFCRNPLVTGLDMDAELHDPWEAAENANEKLVLAFQDYGKPFHGLERLLKGDWPKKRNIVVYTNVDSVEEGRQLKTRLLDSMPYNL